MVAHRLASWARHNALMFFRRRFLAALLLGASISCRLLAQTPDVIIVFKGPGFLQSGPATLQPFQPGYGLFVTFPAAVLATTAVQLNGQGVSIPLTRVLSNMYYAERYFLDETALNTAMPDGAYNLMVSGTTASSTPVTVLSGSSIRPTMFTNYAALQNWTGGTLTLQWDPVQNGSRGDILSVSVVRADGTTLYESPEPGAPGALDGTTTSVTLPALNATPGETLYVHLTYVQLNASLVNNNRTAVATGRGFFLTASLVRALPPRPSIAVQPSSQTVIAGSTVVFWVNANDGATYQWRRNGVPITGATAAAYILPNVQTSAQAFYTVDIGNATGSITSEPATITLAAAGAQPGRISNLAIRSLAGSGAQTLIVGVSVGGSGTSGPKPLLLRGIGPGLAAFGVTGTLADPKLEVYAGASKISENDNWGGNAQIATVAAQVGAFALGASTTADAALYNPSLAPGTYSVQITAASGANGVALAEIYDASPATAFTATTPRLTNVSARSQVGTGGNVLIAGFAISGETSKTVLIRAIGPTLTAFGVPGALANSKLDVFSGNTAIISNDDWGGDAQLTAGFASAGAFPISANSRDAAVLVTLPPGSYTAQVSGVNNTTGIALVEVYELP